MNEYDKMADTFLKYFGAYIPGNFDIDRKELATIFFLLKEETEKDVAEFAGILHSVYTKD